jgi:hypothetical protein
MCSWSRYTGGRQGSFNCMYISGEKKLFCCYGYCIDMLIELQHTNFTNFTYDIHLSTDGAYGSFDRVSIPNVQMAYITSLAYYYKEHIIIFCSYIILL